jgi:hypothetical protein
MHLLLSIVGLTVLIEHGFEESSRGRRCMPALLQQGYGCAVRHRIAASSLAIAQASAAAFAGLTPS